MAEETVQEKKEESKYPECDKMLAVKEDSQIIGEFLDWLLNAQKKSICTQREEGNNGVEPKWVDSETGEAVEYDYTDDLNDVIKINPEFDSWGSGYVADHIDIEKFLAGYFGINLDKVEEERREMLADMRTNNG